MSEITGQDSIETGSPGGLSRPVRFFIEQCERIPFSFITLFARIIMAIVFWQSGRTKVDGFSIKEKTFVLFEYEYNLPLISPETAAYLATFAEHIFPILLIIGLASRMSALGLLTMTFVIEAFVYPEAYVLHSLWAIALITIIARGPGIISIDHLIARKYM